ncbi:MAG: beta-galactosidase, partial [Microbacteriaceae bacterium]
MSMEFWDGWFDWWGGHHHTTDARAAADDLDQLLAMGASVNFYMFHGGTNFGLTSGANDKGRYRPITTSYDYDAPLDEAGNPTEKYYAFRDVIARYAAVPDEVPASAVAAPEFSVAVDCGGDWTHFADESVAIHSSPPTFEQLGYDGALVRYAADLPSQAFASGSAVLRVDEVRDRAWVRVDGVTVGRLDRAQHAASLVVPEGSLVELLVEDQGRVNYDVRIGEEKGLIGTATIGGHPLTGWRAAPVDVESAARAQLDAPRDPASACEVGPVALHGTFALDAASDLFLDTSGWTDGYAFVNGFFLGRYSQSGPQVTLYVPAPVTRQGDNDLLVLELDHTTSATAEFVSAPILGPLEE